MQGKLFLLSKKLWIHNYTHFIPSYLFSLKCVFCVCMCACAVDSYIAKLNIILTISVSLFFLLEVFISLSESSDSSYSTYYH